MRDRAQRLLIDTGFDHFDGFWFRLVFVNRNLSALFRDDRLCAELCVLITAGPLVHESCNCLFGHHSFSDQLLCVEGTRARVLANSLVHHRLSVSRLVALSVTETPVSD